MDRNQIFDVRSTPSASPTSANPTWESRFEELLQWRAEKGDTCVPKAEGALGRWVARQRELKRTGKLDPAREEALNSINFVWNTVTAMWEERFRKLNEWKQQHGHCAVPIAQGELGTWVSKQRQLRKRGKLSKEKIEALDSLKFTWSTAEADWEDKFKRLCEWTRERGHASVPFNEGELGWWVNTQRQCKRKGKLSPSREARLQSLGFVWNPSNSRSRTTTTTTTTTATSSVDTTPSSTPEKPDKVTSQENANAILQLFAEPLRDDTECITQESHSPISAENLPITSVTPEPAYNEPFYSPGDAFLNHNLWSPTIFSSPPPTTNPMNLIPMHGNLHMPVPFDQNQPFGIPNCIQNSTEVLEQLLSRDDDCILDQSQLDALACDEQL